MLIRKELLAGRELPVIARDLAAAFTLSAPALTCALSAPKQTPSSISLHLLHLVFVSSKLFATFLELFISKYSSKFLEHRVLTSPFDAIKATSNNLLTTCKQLRRLDHHLIGSRSTALPRLQYICHQVFGKA